MSVVVLVPALYLLSAIAIRIMGRTQRLVTQILSLLIPLVAGGILIGQLGLSANPSNLWEIGSLSRGVLATTIATTFVCSLLDSSVVTLSVTFWSGGMLTLCALSTSALVQWGAMLFSIAPLLFFRRDVRVGIIRQHPALLLGALMFSGGMLLTESLNREIPGATAGVVLMLCGLGAMLGWFPFPRATIHSRDELTLPSLFGVRFFPLMTAGVLLMRLVEREALTSYQSLLLGMAAIFSLTLCSTRLFQEERFSRRLNLMALSSLSFLVFAISLESWELGHPFQDWRESSNLPTGNELFVSILVCEAIGLLLTVCGIFVLNSDTEGIDYVQTVSGSARRHAAASLPLLAGLFTQAGLPPFPGFWWRLGLITTMLLPHRQSQLTGLTEADHSFALLAVAITVLLVINSLGHLKVVQTMLFDEAFRVRVTSTPWRTRLAGVVSICVFAGIWLVPLSIGRLLVPQRTPAAAETTEEHPDRLLESGKPI